MSTVLLCYYGAWQILTAGWPSPHWTEPGQFVMKLLTTHCNITTHHNISTHYKITTHCNITSSCPDVALADIYIVSRNKLTDGETF